VGEETMIHVYGIAYWMESYVQRSIESIKSHTKYPFRLTVVENKSPHDLSGLRSEADCWIQLDNNPLEKCLKHAYKLDPPQGDIIVFTDLDVLVPDGVDWVEEALSRLAFPEVGLVAFDLNLINYTPPNFGQYVAEEFSNRYGAYIGPSGAWLIVMRRTDADRFIRDNDITLDHNLMESVEIALRLPVELYHLGWDAWKDDDDYWQLKVKRFNQRMRIVRNIRSQLDLAGYKIWRKEDEEAEHLRSGRSWERASELSQQYRGVEH
jgi:hypothetical protein